MNMDYFDKRFRRTDSMMSLFFRVIFGVFILYFALMVIFIIGAVYFAFTTSPEEVGAFFGNIVGGFNAASQ
jgi:hypothetical protein